MSARALIYFLQLQMAKKPNFFLFREEEPLATFQEIEAIEKHIAATLPIVFKEFQQKFGGGTFGYAELYAISPKSEYYVFQEPLCPNDFFPIANDGIGGFYGFVKNENEFADKVYYWDNTLQRTSYQQTKYSFASFFLWSAFNLKVNWFSDHPDAPYETVIKCTDNGKYQVYHTDERANLWGVITEFDTLEEAINKFEN